MKIYGSSVVVIFMWCFHYELVLCQFFVRWIMSCVNVRLRRRTTYFLSCEKVSKERFPAARERCAAIVTLLYLHDLTLGFLSPLTAIAAHHSRLAGLVRLIRFPVRCRRSVGCGNC